MATINEKTGFDDEEFDSLRIEAEAAVNEIRFAVAYAELSTKLPRSDDLVYINLKTKENETYCVELCLQGFRIVGREFDAVVESEQSQYFETIYALVDTLSPQYRLSFGEALSEKLMQLQRQEDGDDTRAT